MGHWEDPRRWSPMGGGQRSRRSGGKRGRCAAVAVVAMTLVALLLISLLGH